MMPLPVKPRLLVGVGNPCRGDDALGPLLIERLEGRLGPGVELLSDDQLKIEHVMDIAGREQVFFVDAAAAGPAPFLFQAIAAAGNPPLTSHGLSPAALLETYRRFYDAPPPPCHVLAIRGYAFGLGQPLSPQAEANLEAAVRFVERRLASAD